ncbi:MAG: glutamate--tRNA ligase [Candidatus Marinimicrobia bacterium]|nr:glutamate--tRNA ligase [Candidatus Neomarinimicrobiota bacterium]
MTEVRTRFAPSPTGFLHVGGAYSALLDYAFARKHQGKFILRIEDTDIKRSVEGAEEAIDQGLEWLGIKPDESPKLGGSFGPYRQSERLSLYQQYALELVEKGNAYYCFCSSQRLAEARKEREKKGLPPMYDQKCRGLDKKAAEERAKKEEHVIRLKVPEDEKIIVPEPIRGEIVFESKVVDDQILLKSDGFPTYHLAVVVDDHLMKITHAVRGEEWLSSAPKHYLLYQYFGWQPPIYFHTPAIRNPDKSKLSKREGHTSLRWYQEQGYLPEALVNFLFLLGWSHPEEKEVFGLDEFIKLFDLKDLSPAGPVFNLEKLDWLNGVYIRETENAKLKTQIDDFYEKKYPADLINQTIPLVKDRIKKLSDYRELAGFFFEMPKIDRNLFEKNAKLQFKQAIEVLSKVEKWEKGEIERVLQGLIKKKGWGTGSFFMNFRLAITGSKFTPPITDSVAILGSKETLHRLQSCLKLW